VEIILKIVFNIIKRYLKIITRNIWKLKKIYKKLELIKKQNIRDILNLVYIIMHIRKLMKK